MSLASEKILPNVSEVVVAVFTHLKNAKDAICDLSKAGFDASQIKVAYASASHAHGDVASAEHTLIWKLRDSFERDLHRQGADQVSGQGGGNAHPSSPFTEVDLQTALSEIGVAPDRITLLEHEIAAGVLILVKSGGHNEKAFRILEKNEGTIRTDTALEAAPRV